MFHKRWSSPPQALVVCVFAGAAALAALAAPPSRIHRNLDDGETFVLTGNMHPLASSAVDLGSADSALVLPRIAMHFNMSAAQSRDLTSLLQTQQDRSSPSYHKWLTEEQYANRFGLSQSDLSKIVAWLQNAGFGNIEIAKGRDAVTMSGSAVQAQDALRTPIHRFQLQDGTHYANAADPVLPKALQGMVDGIRGLTDIRPRPHSVKPDPRFTSNITGNIFMAPGDFATIYDLQPLYGAGIDGTGQKIAISGQTDIQLSDIDAFRLAAGLPANDPQVVLDGSDPGTSANDESEADLDIEWAGAVARNATIVYVNSSDAFTSALYAIDNGLAPVVSLTYGLCEAQTDANTVTALNAEFQKANAKGITVVAASGDSGAADCDGAIDPKAPAVTVATHGLAVDFPASSPYVTAMGGTEFNEGTGTYWSTSNNSTGGSAVSYIPEMAWNDTAAVGELSASGGGASTLFAKPSWQQGTGVPADNARDVPDVSLDASVHHEGYLICSAGSCVNGFRDASASLNLVGGTSVAAPTFAGIVALINQKTNSTQGNINPVLYSLASVSSDAFHDITVGNNQVPCKAGTPNCPGAAGTTGALGFVTGAGYDQVTGLGSVDANNLVNEWASDFQIAVTPATLTVSAGGTGTATVQITRFANFSGSVALTCAVPSTLTKTTCSVPLSVSGSAGSVTLTITNSSAAGGAVLFRSLRDFPPAGCAFAALLLLSGGLLLFPHTRARQATGAAVAVMAFAIMTPCGGGGSSSSGTTQSIQPASTTASVTVTATAGILKHTATVAVTIP